MHAQQARLAGAVGADDRQPLTGARRRATRRRRRVVAPSATRQLRAACTGTPVATVVPRHPLIGAQVVTVTRFSSREWTDLVQIATARRRDRPEIGRGPGRWPPGSRSLSHQSGVGHHVVQRPASRSSATVAASGKVAMRCRMRTVVRREEAGVPVHQRVAVLECLQHPGRGRFEVLDRPRPTGIGIITTSPPGWSRSQCAHTEVVGRQCDHWASCPDRGSRRRAPARTDGSGRAHRWPASPAVLHERRGQQHDEHLGEGRRTEWRAHAADDADVVDEERVGPPAEQTSVLPIATLPLTTASATRNQVRGFDGPRPRPRRRGPPAPCPASADHPAPGRATTPSRRGWCRRSTGRRPVAVADRGRTVRRAGRRSPPRQPRSAGAGATRRATYGAPARACTTRQPWRTGPRGTST